jgi:hypothetical protein
MLPLKVNPDEWNLNPAFVLLLSDGFAKARTLHGIVEARIDARAASFQKDPDGTFVFLNALAPGKYTVGVRSSAKTPFYLPVDIPITLPFASARWPAYPDLSLADPDKMLDDPAQPAAYRAQLQLASLQPTTAYPFPLGTTLVRGTVSGGAARVSGATVHLAGQSNGYQTGDDGEYVLYFDQIVNRAENVTLVASKSGKPNVSMAVNVLRGLTVSVDFKLAA